MSCEPSTYIANMLISIDINSKIKINVNKKMKIKLKIISFTIYFFNMSNDIESEQCLEPEPATRNALCYIESSKATI